MIKSHNDLLNDTVLSIVSLFPGLKPVQIGKSSAVVYINDCETEIDEVKEGIEDFIGIDDIFEIDEDVPDNSCSWETEVCIIKFKN